MIEQQVRQCRRDLEGERGQALILVAVLLMALVGFAGLVVDYGKGAWEHRQAQNAADAAALDAAFAIYNGSDESTATTNANQIAQQHGFDSWDTPTLTFLDKNGNQTGTPSSVQYVKVVATDSFATTPLMRMLGVSTITVYGRATAKIPLGGIGQCVLCLLEPNNTGLNASDGSTVTVGPGNIAVNSSCSNCAVVTSNASITAPQIGIVGGTQWSGQDPFHPDPTPISPVPDPLAHVPVPTCASGNPTGQGSIVLSDSSSQTLSPGTYQSIDLSNNASVTLQPGIYCITGGLSTKDTSTFTGNGVMLYFTCGSYPNAQPCATGQAGGGVNFSDNSVYNVTAPTSGTYQGLSFFYDRNNVAGINISDTSVDSYSGTIYAQSSTMTLSDGGGTTQLDSLIVVNSLDMSSGSLSVSDNPQDNYQFPQIPVLSQ